MEFSRRHALKLGAGAMALWTLNGSLNAAEAGKKIPIGLQLYSIRQQAEKDLAGVLKAVAQMGYQGVEFAGYYGWKAADIRKLLDDNNLKCCGTHTALETVTGENLQRTVEFNQTIGNKYLIVPYIPEKRFETLAAVKEIASFLTETAAKVKDQGMRVGYHAHAGDFKKIDGETTWDLLFANAGPGVIMQLDTDNSLQGGGDPYAILRKFPGRSATIHIKEHGGKPGAVIGEGDVRWKEIFELCETIGGTEWYIVEHESDPKTPLESVRKCLESLRKMGK